MIGHKPTNEGNLALIDKLITGWENEIVEFNEAVYPALSADLTEEQRYDKVGNLLRKMRKDRTVSFGRSSSRWYLA
jgi:hypothetical protein